MSNPEQQGGKPVSKPQTEDNVPVQDGADKAEHRPKTKGAGVIGLVSLVLVVLVAFLLIRYLF